MSAFFGGSAASSVTLLGLIANTVYILPAYTIIKRIAFKNNTTNVVTGGIKVGTTSGGVDIILAQAVGANALVIASSLIPAMLATDRSIYLQAVTSWNSANVDVSIEIMKMF